MSSKKTSIDSKDAGHVQLEREKRSRGTSRQGEVPWPPRIPERPQGVGMARKGYHECSYKDGCEGLFKSKNSLHNHACNGRRKTYLEMIQMNLDAGREPPLEYLNEIMRYEHTQLSGSESSQTNFKDCLKLLPRDEKTHRTQKWVEHSDFTQTPPDINFNLFQ